MSTPLRVACLLLLALRSSIALAQPAAVDEAREHFQRGVGFYKDESFDAALDEFKQAYELASNYRVLFNIGQVQLERHDYAAALKAFQSYLEAGGKDISDERREQVERDLNTLNQRVAHLRVKSTVADAEVVLDGSVVAKTPMSASILINPGLVRLSVRKAGYQTNAETFTVAATENKLITADLQPLVAAGPLEVRHTDAPAPEPVSHRNYTPAWVALGVTGVLAVGTTALALRTHQLDNELGQRLATFPGDAGAIADSRSSLKHYALATDVVGGGAAVALGLTVYFALSPSTAHDASSTRVGLAAFPAGSGLQLVSHF